MIVKSPAFEYETGYGRLIVACSSALKGIKHGNLLVADPSKVERSVFRFTMWETTELPIERRQFNTDVLIVPCEHNRKLFRKYTRKPIEVCPLFGAGTFSHLPPARPFRFICVARENGVPSRKGIKELVSWFTEAFPTQPDVSLTIKQSPSCAERYTYDKRIVFIREDFNHAKYQELLAAHHCGIFLSGAEAWNFPVSELMATGRPAILIPFGGPADFTTQKTSWHLPYKLVDAPQEVYRGIGKVAFPDKRGTIQAMREAYSDQLLLAEKAIASAKASHEYTEARFAQRLRSIINRYG